MSNAASRLEVPSMFLIGAGALGVLAQVVGLIQGLAGGDEIPPELWDQVPADQMALVESIVGFVQAVGPLISLVFMAISAFVVFGGLQMRAGKGYGFAVAASIVAMFQCSLACCIGLPVGLWCLVVLLNDDVKAAFT